MSGAPLAHSAPAALELTLSQRQCIQAAAARLLWAIVTENEAALPDPTWAGAAGCLVAGAFVSLKRAGHLRACCGGLLERAVPLKQAVEHAVLRTALEDVRFPPVSPTELPYLDMEVWLLFNPQRVPARGDERALAVVTGGKHGVVVRHGQNSGLLLPGVAAEHGWDAQTFLEQVCAKAGLSAGRWKDDDATLLTFEGESLRGRAVAEGTAEVPPPFLSPGQVAAYAEFCRTNLAALLLGAAPRYSCFEAPDGNVSGVLLSLGDADGAERLQFSQISLRPPLALQGTLLQLVQTAAQHLAGRGACDSPNASAPAVGLAVLYDPAMHGTVRDPDLRGLDVTRRALLVLQRARWGLAFDPEQSPEDLLAEAAVRAQVAERAAVPVYSLQVNTTEPRLGFAAAPRPVAGPEVRPAAVAGKFYPHDPDRLFALVDELLAGQRGEEAWPAALVPHAGLRFSGRIAAAVLRRLAVPRTVIVIGPKHTPYGMEWAVAPHRRWQIPGATLDADPELAQQLAEAIPGLALDAAAHQQEHAIEVELPFLARLAPHARVVGIAVGQADLAGCRRFAQGLAGVLRRRQDRPLLLISSDMNHFATDAETRRLDEMALCALERLDPQDVYQTVRRNQISMCGVLPAVIVLETLRRLGGLQRAERVGYATTADTTGDPGRVVGYAGMLFG